MIRRNKGDFISYGILHRFDTEFAHIQYIPTYKVYICQKSRFTFCVQVFGTQPNSLQLLLLLVLFFFLEFSNEFVSVVKERNNFTEAYHNTWLSKSILHERSLCSNHSRQMLHLPVCNLISTKLNLSRGILHCGIFPDRN